MIDVNFQLKGSAITVVVLAIIRYEPKSLVDELKEKIAQAPQFFVNSPVLINLALTSANSKGYKSYAETCNAFFW